MIASGSTAAGSDRPGLVSHLAAVAVFIALAIWSTFPLVLRLTTSVPALGAGDNVTTLWNFWWFAQTGPTLAFFSTDKLFFPFGTSLVLHTHTALPAFAGWTLLPFTSVTAAHNIVLLAGLSANGIVTYMLALRYARLWPSLVAGTLVALSTFVQVHLYGHFNLTHVWVLPAFILALLRFTERPAPIRAATLAVSLAIITYTDYYYAVFAWIFVGVFLAWARVTVTFARAERPSRGLRRAALLLLAADAILILTILVARAANTEITAGPLSLRSIRNPLTLFWLLAAIWLFAEYRIRIARRAAPVVQIPSGQRWGIALLCYLVLIAPLIYLAVRLVAAGDYVAPPMLWLSSNPGIDLVTFVLGPPRHFLVGPPVQSAHEALGIDIVEQSGYLGLLALGITAVGVLRRHYAGAASLWTFTAVVFGILSLGPFLRFAGMDLALPLPDAILRYVPLFSNARIPGRAFVMVQLALAVLVAISLSRFNLRPRMAALVGVLLVAEILPAPMEVSTLPQADLVDRELQTAGRAGAVIELPLGLRDGFGETGLLEHRALVHQTHHGRPMAGGFVARLSPRVRSRYLETPLFAALLSISAGERDTQLPPDAAAQARALGFGFVVVNRDTPAGALPTRADLERAGFELVLVDGPRELFR